MTKRTTQRRYVYLMERVTKRGLGSILTGRREIKIGVGVRPKTRRTQVDRGIPGKIVLLYQKKVNSASRVETELHRTFKKHNFVVRGAKQGAGGTEFFRLTNSQIQQAKKILDQKAGIKQKTLALFRNLPSLDYRSIYLSLIKLIKMLLLPIELNCSEDSIINTLQLLISQENLIDEKLVENRPQDHKILGEIYEEIGPNKFAVLLNYIGGHIELAEVKGAIQVLNLIEPSENGKI